MQRQPNPDDPAYRDQSKRKTLDDKKTETPGEKLEKERIGPTVNLDKVLVDDTKLRPPIFRKKIENEKNIVNFKGKSRL